MIGLNQFHHQDDRPKLLDSLAPSIFALNTHNFSSFLAFKPNSYSTSKSIAKVSDSSCIIKSCLHFNSACNPLIFSFVASINLVCKE